MPATKTLRICPNGHRFYKSSDCPTCPKCEKGVAPKQGFLTLLSGPARRALEHEGITTPRKLSRYTEKQILSLHGMGPGSLPLLRKMLKDEGLAFKQ